MAYIHRTLDLTQDLKKKSVFLLGPRQTGKSSWIRNQLKNHHLFNLLLPDTYNQLSFDPQSLIREISDNKKIVVIDEIQRIPKLLDVVHYLIEEKQIRFLLTGSSARKLRTQSINLLGGRARIRHLNPFTYKELGSQFNLNMALSHGLLPSHYFSDDIESDLSAYIGTYIQQEIAYEGLTRNIPAFSRFLEVAAHGHGEQIHFTNIASDAQVPRTTIHEYYQILKDTLIAHEVPAWQKTTKRKPVATSKYYFFDWGVARKLQKTGAIQERSPMYGKAFESFIFQELKAHCDQNGIEDLHYWRTTNQDEVDFILNNEIAIEVKAKPNVTLKDLKSLAQLKAEKKLKRFILIYTGITAQRFTEQPDIEVLPWSDFLISL